MPEAASFDRSILEEFLKITVLARTLIPKQLDGREAITLMREQGSKNWRQMEWIGFWFEHFIETQVQPSLGNTVGPRYGNTVFDLKLNHVWDLKAHPDHNDSLILNDQQAIQSCIEENNGVGFIIVHGSVKYDDAEESFKKWHDNFKGGESKYVKARIERKAPSRRRKVLFCPKRIDGVWIEDIETLHRGIDEGWIDGFQKDMRNSNGRPRRAKFQLKTQKIPVTNIVGSIEI